VIAHDGSYFDKRLMICVMSKRVNKPMFMLMITFLMIIPPFLLSVVYFRVYKAAIESLNQRLQENEENYIEQHNKLNETYRFKRVLVINLHEKAYCLYL